MPYIKEFLSENKLIRHKLEIIVTKKVKNMFKVKDSEFEFESEWVMTSDFPKKNQCQILKEKNLKS